MAISDKICGYVLASAVGMALFARERTGEGQEVHVPMMETMTAFNLVDHLWHGVLGEPEKRGSATRACSRRIGDLTRPRTGMSACWRRPIAVAQPVRGDRPSRTRR